MDATYEKKYHHIEDDYWWFQARRDVIVRLVGQRLKLPAKAEILEVGCSGGPLLAALRERGFSHLHGIDISPDAIAHCHERDLHDVAVMDAIHPTYPANSFDLIIASDILEHLEQHEEALANWHQMLKPGGTLLVFVPAFMFLWTGHDVINRHFRRYTRGNLLKALRGARFSITLSSYWNSALFPPVAAMRTIKRLFARNAPPTDALKRVSPVVNQSLRGLLTFENVLLTHGIRSPLGVSVMAIAKKDA